MYRDKLLTTFRNLNLKFEGLTELLEDRNLLLKILMQKEMREDFLLSERLQSLDEVGGYNVKAMNRNVDLSPVNEMMPPLDIKTQDDEGEVPFKDGGAVGTCSKDTFSIVSPGNLGSPIICGFNTGQHSTKSFLENINCRRESYKRWNVVPARR